MTKQENLLKLVNECIGNNGILQGNEGKVKYCKIVIPDLPCEYRVEHEKLKIDCYGANFFLCIYEKKQV